jgi:hypothetical protein
MVPCSAGAAGLLHRFKIAEPLLRFLEEFHADSGILSLVETPFLAPVVEILEHGNFAVRSHLRPGVYSRPFVPLNIEAANLREGLPLKGRRQRGQELPIAANGMRLPVGLNPLEKLIAGIIEENILSLFRTDPRFMPEHLRPFDTRQLGGDVARDAFPELEDVARAVVSEIQIPDLAA